MRPLNHIWDMATIMNMWEPISKKLGILLFKLWRNLKIWNLTLFLVKVVTSWLLISVRMKGRFPTSTLKLAIMKMMNILMLSKDNLGDVIEFLWTTPFADGWPLKKACLSCLSALSVSQRVHTKLKTSLGWLSARHQSSIKMLLFKRSSLPCESLQILPVYYT